MNKTYRSIWSEADQTWVAAPETAAARGKSARRLAVLATSTIGLAASFAPSAGATTTTTPAAPTPGTVGNGGLELCSGAKGYSWGFSGGSQSIDCSVDGKGATDGLAFSLNNSADSKGGYGFNGSTAQVAGYQNGTLNIRGASIMVYGPTTFDSIVTMSNKKIVQLAPGLLSADSTEAVNGSQLYTTNQKLDKTADDVANFTVKYDSTARDEVTFGGKGSSKAVKLHNVAAGTLSAASLDAVNGSQLYATNQNVTNLQGEVADAVKYDSSAHDDVTFGGKGSSKAVKVHNVAAGTLSATSLDAVNGSQLYATNQNVTNLQGQVADAVKYDASAHDEVTFGGKGSSKAVKLHNVAAGTLSAASLDAVNGSQLYATNQNVTNLQGEVADAVKYDSTAHDEVTFGGKGSSKAVKVHNVAAGTLSATSSDAVNGSQLYATNQKLDKTTDDVANIQTQVADAVKYDSSAHDEVTLGGKGSSKAVKLHNVAAGALSATSSDAVNGSQLYATNQNVTNLQGEVADAVKYDSTAHDEVTLGGKGSSKAVTLHNVAAGTLSAASLDAVNGSQLYATNQKLDKTTDDVANIQTQVADAVKYDSSAHDEVTFGGKGSSKAVTLHNVAAGTLSAASLDAVNGSQLYATNQKLDKTTDDVANIQTQVADAVKYDSSAHDEVTLGGKGSGTPVKLHNVSAADLAPASTDAVNGSQLYATNLNITNLQGQVADAVMYDTPAHDTLTLGGIDAKKPVALHNVAAGDLAAASADAVNGSQLYSVNQAVINNTTAITELTENIYNGRIGIVQQDPATRDITVGKSTDGAVVNLTGTAGARRLTGLAAGLGTGDAVNVAQMQSAGFQFDAAGAVRNKSVTYDIGSIAAGRPSITLATGNGDSPYWRNPEDRGEGHLPLGTIISNVADGIVDTDAVNLGQVNDLILEAIKRDQGKILAAHQYAAVDPGSVGDASQGAANAVQYDSSAHDTITLSSTDGGKVLLTGLQNGEISSTSTDAVTGQQLFQSIANLGQSVQNIAANGTTAVSANTTSGAAAAAGTQSVAVGGGAVATGVNSTAVGDSANASAENSVAIGANSIANRVNAVSVGQEGAERQIVNVAAGASGTDAVNVNQLNNTIAQQSNAFNQRIAGLQNSINTVQKNAYAGVAAAMAMPNLTPSGPGRTVVAAGGGYYKGGSAAAVGVTYRSANAHWLVNGSVAVTNNGDAGARAQIGYEF